MKLLNNYSTIPLFYAQLTIFKSNLIQQDKSIYIRSVLYIFKQHYIYCPMHLLRLAAARKQNV